MAATDQIDNGGIKYRPAGNHTAHDSTALTLNPNAIMAVAGTSGTVVVADLNGDLTTMYCVLGQLYPVGDVTLLKATGNITSFALFV